jgi:hypothetical protein
MPDKLKFSLREIMYTRDFPRFSTPLLQILPERIRNLFLFFIADGVCSKGGVLSQKRSEKL